MYFRLSCTHKFDDVRLAVDLLVHGVAVLILSEMISKLNQKQIRLCHVYIRLQ